MAVKWQVPFDEYGNMQRTERHYKADPTAKMVDPDEFNGEVKFLRIGPKFSDTEYFMEVVVRDRRSRDLRTAFTAPMFMREFERMLQDASPFLGGFESTVPQNHSYGTPDKRTEHKTPRWGVRGRFGFIKRGAYYSLSYLGPEVH